MSRKQTLYHHKKPLIKIETNESEMNLRKEKFADHYIPVHERI